MKLLLFLALSFIGAGALAQLPKENYSWRLPPPGSLGNFKGNNEAFLRKQFQHYFEGRKFENQLLADKQGNIVRLPQDHMPCIVPDSASAAVMPNAWGGVTVPYRPQFDVMPNPGLPKQPSKEDTNEEKNDHIK